MLFLVIRFHMSFFVNEKKIKPPTAILGYLTWEVAPIPCPEYCTDREGSVFNTGVVSVVTEDGEVLAEADDPGNIYQIVIRDGRSKAKKYHTHNTVEEVHQGNNLENCPQKDGSRRAQYFVVVS